MVGVLGRCRVWIAQIGSPFQGENLTVGFVPRALPSARLVEAFGLRQGTKVSPWLRIGGEPVADFGTFGVGGFDFENFEVVLTRQAGLVELLRVKVGQ